MSTLQISALIEEKEQQATQFIVEDDGSEVATNSKTKRYQHIPIEEAANKIVRRHSNRKKKSKGASKNVAGSSNSSDEQQTSAISNVINEKKKVSHKRALRSNRQQETGDKEGTDEIKETSSQKFLRSGRKRVITEHYEEESSSKDTQKSPDINETPNNRTLRSSRQQGTESPKARQKSRGTDASPKATKKPAEEEASPIHNDDGDEQQMLREIEDGLNSITKFMFSKMGEHFNENPQDIEDRFNDITERMSPFVNAAENIDSNREESTANGKSKAKKK